MLKRLKEDAPGYGLLHRVFHDQYVVEKGNITETVEEDKPSIITSVQTEPVTFADCHFLEDAVRNTERVTGQLVRNVYADGAYQSPDNREFAKLHMGMELLTGKQQGGCRYLLDREPGTDLTLLAEVSAFSVLKFRFSVSEQMFNPKATL